jgi:hypothetical protein
MVYQLDSITGKQAIKMYGTIMFTYRLDLQETIFIPITRFQLR